MDRIIKSLFLKNHTKELKKKWFGFQNLKHIFFSSHVLLWPYAKMQKYATYAKSERSIVHFHSSQFIIIQNQKMNNLTDFEHN
jgi:hypothetical protein